MESSQYGDRRHTLGIKMIVEGIETLSVCGIVRYQLQGISGLFLRARQPPVALQGAGRLRRCLRARGPQKNALQTEGIFMTAI